MDDKNWPFEQPRNSAVLLIKQIIEKEAPILFVSHEFENNLWQFLSNIEFSDDDSIYATLELVVETDPTLLELADLKPGYCAWRNAVGEPWITKEFSDD